MLAIKSADNISSFYHNTILSLLNFVIWGLKTSLARSCCLALIVRCYFIIDLVIALLICSEVSLMDVVMV